MTGVICFPSISRSITQLSSDSHSTITRFFRPGMLSGSGIYGLTAFFCSIQSLTIRLSSSDSFLEVLTAS